MHTFAQKPKATQQTTSAKSTIPGRGHLGQSLEVRSILHLQRTIGNQAVQRMLQTDAEEPEADLTRPASLRFEHDFSRIPIHPPAAGAIQTKLAINELGDSYEQDADRMAEQVMRTPEPQLQRACPCGGGCPNCHTEQPGREHESLQTKRVQASDTGQIAAPPIVHEVLRSPGQPLDPATRAFMEPRFGYDFSRVWVHTGAAAEESARDVNAHAYTVGHDVVFGAGRFAPGTQGGRRLIAHELTHVVQQRRTGPRLARSPDDKEAAAIGSGIEPLEVKEWQKTLEAQGYEVFTRRQFDRVDWLAKAFSDRRARPDLVAINRTKRHVLVGDITAGPWSPTALKPGDVRKLPRDIGAEPETKHHLEKTVDNARQAHKHLPEDLRGFSVTAQDRWWKEGGHSREITIAKGTPAPKPTGGALPSSTSTSGAGGGRSTPATSAPAVTTKVTAEIGAPLEPVVEATPGFNPGAGAGIGGAVQLLQAKMFGNLQQAEIAKYEKRLAELQPKIDAFLRSGYSVELILIVEKPNSPDVLCGAGVFCDQGQFIYFHDLYINYVESVKPVTSPSPRATTSQTSMSSPGGRDGFIPYTHQGGSIIDEKEIRYLSTRDSIHHCEYGKLTLYPQESISPIEASRPPAQPVKTKPRLDPATKKALALAPSRVYILSGNINQYKTAYEIEKKLTGNASFVVAMDEMTGSLNRRRTIVSYSSDLDKPRAEALAEIVRSEGVSSVDAELSGDGDDAPGVLQIFFGRDAEK